MIPTTDPLRADPRRRRQAAADYGWIRGIFDAWRAEGVLIQDPEPAICDGPALRLTDGATLERIGFFAELGLEEHDARIVRPHERTLAGPKADRLKLLRAAEANLSSVFLLYEDPQEALGALLADALDRSEVGRASDGAGVEYRLARLTDAAAIARVGDFLASRPSVIADGHHRYETALEYRRECRAREGDLADAPWESTIAYFANAYARGSLLLPIHRVVTRLPAPSQDEWRKRLPQWQVTPLPRPDPDRIDAFLAPHLAPLAEHPSFVAEPATGEPLLIQRAEPLGEALMVRILEQEILGGVFGLDGEAIRAGAVLFPKSAKRAGQAVRAGDGTVALYLNPTTPEAVFRTTAKGDVMPQKSTFFYPKVPTGMVFRDHRTGRAQR